MSKKYLSVLVLITFIFCALIIFVSLKHDNKDITTMFSAIATVLATAVTFYVAYSAENTSKRSVRISEDALKISNEMKHMEIMNESPSLFISSVHLYNGQPFTINVINLGNSVSLSHEMREKFSLDGRHLNTVVYPYNNLPTDGTQLKNKELFLELHDNFYNETYEGWYELFYKDFSGNQFKTIFEVIKGSSGGLVVKLQKRELA